MRDHYDFSNAEPGPVIKPRGRKERITIRLDKDVLDWFKDAVDAAGGGSYQGMINDVLAGYIEQQQRKHSIYGNADPKNRRLPSSVEETPPPEYRTLITAVRSAVREELDEWSRGKTPKRK